MSCLPPRFLILKALGKSSNGSVKWVSHSCAHVDDIMVSFDQNTNEVSCEACNDFLSYHAICILMLKGVLPVDERISRPLKEIDWDTYVDNYAGAESDVKRELFVKGVTEEYVDSYIERVMKRIRENGFKFRSANKQQSLLFSYK